MGKNLTDFDALSLPGKTLRVVFVGVATAAITSAIVALGMSSGAIDAPVQKETNIQISGIMADVP